jgi:transposase
LGLFFAIHADNIRTGEFEQFVAGLLQRLPHGIILVMDRWMVHRAAARRLFRRFPRRLWIEWLPPYAPDLNPDEHVWRQTKHADLANYLPEDVAALGRSVRGSLRRSQRSQRRLRSFFSQAGLKL